MAKKISIVSPARGQGETTAAVLIAKSLEYALKDKKVCITLAGTDYESIRTYIGKENTKDPTRTSANMLISLRANEMSDLSSYVTSLGGNLDVFLPANHLQSEKDNEEFHNLVVDRLDREYEYIVTDLSIELGSDEAIRVYNTYDFIFIILPQNTATVAKLQKWADSGIFPPRYKVVYLFNRYDSEIGNEAAMLTRIGLPKKSLTANIPYSPRIPQLANKGLLLDVVDRMPYGDEEYLVLHNALGNIVDLLKASIPDNNLNWED